MTNKDRQKQLDLKKWFTSKQYRKDLSGSMSYCIKCDKVTYSHSCRATQKEREEYCLCAKAYNKMIRRNKHAQTHQK